MEPKIQNTFQYLATKKIRQITTNTHNTLHKRHQNHLNQIKNILQQNNLTIAKADKSKTIVIINKNILQQKIDAFVQENQIKSLNKDLTDLYQKQIQQVIQKFDILIDRRTHKCLMNIKPMAPKLNAYIKTHKENEPIRPVVNNTQAPSYKTTKYLNKKLHHLMCLPRTYPLRIHMK